MQLPVPEGVETGRAVSIIIIIIIKTRSKISVQCMITLEHYLYSVACILCDYPLNPDLFVLG